MALEANLLNRQVLQSLITHLEDVHHGFTKMCMFRSGHSTCLDQCVGTHATSRFELSTLDVIIRALDSSATWEALVPITSYTTTRSVKSRIHKTCPLEFLTRPQNYLFDV